jgi:hypothetical protein
MSKDIVQVGPLFWGCISPSTPRVRRYRERRREGLRQLTVEVPEAVIEQAIGRGILKPEESAMAWDVIQACYAAQLSDAALDRLISVGVITREQRNDAVAILRRIGKWLEQTGLEAA